MAVYEEDRPFMHGPGTPVSTYHANTFTVNLPEDWKDETVYTFTGPFEDDFQHLLTVNVDPNVQVETLLDYADLHIQIEETSLKGCRLLHKNQVRLDNGLPAYRATFVWYPAENLRFYREQIYVLRERTGYILTATFTRKTHLTLGPKFERMMLAFQPLP